MRERSPRIFIMAFGMFLILPLAISCRVLIILLVILIARPNLSTFRVIAILEPRLSSLEAVDSD